MTDEKISPDEIEFTPEFKRSLRTLAKKYRSIRLDVQPVIDQILLNEPIELEPNTELLVTVLPKSSDEERDNWAALSLEYLAQAYGNDEPEYSLDLIKEANPEYEGK